MQLHTASRPTRVRRLLAVSAAAVAVMIAPTACDYGGYGAGAHSGDLGDTGNMPGMDHGSQDPNQNPVVVPVGNTTDTSADATSTTATKASYNDRRRHRPGRNHGQTTTAAATTTTAPTTEPAATTDPAATTSDTATTAPTTAPPAAGGGAAAGVGSVGAGGKDGNNNGLDVLGRDCTKSSLPAHNGFQESPACVSTQMGEVAAKNKLPSLLIVDAPKAVGVGQAFTLKISTRNLIRDRFLGAKAGGYYLESSFLDPNTGLQRGHFHTACRILPSVAEAPDSSGDPEFFLATEDKGGSDKPDVVTIEVPATSNKASGELQCTSWAGDGSHRTPMMTQANETPAIDSVRITVTNDGAPPSGYRLAAGNDPAAAQADAAQQADAKQADAAGQKPDVEKNGTTDSGQGAVASGPAASEVASATAAPSETAAPAATAAPADPAPADSAVETTAAKAPADN